MLACLVSQETIQRHTWYQSIAFQHAVHQIDQWSIKVFSTRKPMLVNEEYVMLEARVEVRLETQLNDDRIVVTVNVRIDAV